MVALVVSSGFMLKFLQNHYRDRPLNLRGRNQAPVRSPRSNGRVMTPPETNILEGSSHEPSPAHIHVHQVGVKAGLSEPCHSSSPEKKTQPNANGLVHPVDRVVEFGSVGHLYYGPPSLDSNRQPNTCSTIGQDSSVGLSSPRTPRSRPGLGTDQDRYDNIMNFLFFFLNSCYNMSGILLKLSLSLEFCLSLLSPLLV